MDNSQDVHTSVESAIEVKVKWATHKMFIHCREGERSKVGNS